MNVHADGQPQESVNLTHPFRVTFCKIIVDRNDMHSLFAERVEVSGKRCHKGFTFACFQLRNSALMHAYTAHQLNFVMTHVQNPVRRFSHDGERVVHNLVERFAVFKPTFQNVGLVL